MSVICMYIEDAHRNRSMLGSMLSDMWKEAFCSRPRHFNFRTMTTIELNAEMDDIMPAHDAAMDEYYAEKPLREAYDAIVLPRQDDNNAPEQLPPEDHVYAMETPHAEANGTRVWTF